MPSFKAVTDGQGCHLDSAEEPRLRGLAPAGLAWQYKAHATQGCHNPDCL